MNPIEDPLAKIVWAEINLDSLEKLVTDFEQGDCYALFEEPDLEDGLKIYQLIRADQPLQIPAMTGDIIANLRGALDHLMWAIARMRTPTPFNRTCFPIYPERVTSWTNRTTGKTESRNNEREIRRVCQSLPKKAVDLVNAFQPYNRGGDPFKDPLYILDALWNIDKHRTVVPISAAMSVPIFRPPASLGYLDDGTIIFKVPPAFDPETHLKPNLTFRVAFPPKPPADGRLLIPLLRELYQAVMGDVIPAFLRFFPKDVPPERWVVTMRSRAEPM